MKESWKRIEGFDGYEVSDLGRVKSLQRRNKRFDQFLKGIPDRDGYYRVCLRKESKSYRRCIHRLVASAFIPNPNNKKQVNHKFGIVTDNRASQLEWVTHSENNQHAYDVLGRVGAWTGKRGGAHHRSKSVVCLNTGVIYGSTLEAERELGLRGKSVSEVCLGNRKTTKNLSFKYV